MLKVCSGKDSNPSIPNAPVGQIAGWIAEYSSGKVYLCGGQDSSVHKVCAREQFCFVFKWAIPASFLFIFVLFSLQFQ